MKYVKIGFSGIGTGFFYILGGFDKALIMLLLAMSIDYFTGLIKAFKKSKLNSKIGKKGIAKKLYMLSLVAISFVIDEIMGKTGIIRNLMIYYIIANEGLSIIENSAEFGFPIPEFLKNALEQLKQENEK